MSGRAQGETGQLDKRGWEKGDREMAVPQGRRRSGAIVVVAGGRGGGGGGGGGGGDQRMKEKGNSEDTENKEGRIRRTAWGSTVNRGAAPEQLENLCGSGWQPSVGDGLTTNLLREATPECVVLSGTVLHTRFNRCQPHVKITIQCGRLYVPRPGEGFGLAARPPVRIARG